MRATNALLAIFLFASLSPAAAQTQIDAATRQDVVDMMQLTGVRDRMQSIYSAMASQVASAAAEHYGQQHPDADPAQLQKVATAAADRAQQTFKAMPTDELLDAMIPVYQKYLTHSDVRAVTDFYSSPTGQKLLKDSTAMMIDAMQAAQAVMKKRMPEIEAQVEKAASDAGQPEASQTAPVPPK
jgi:hypothetical protein